LGEVRNGNHWISFRKAVFLPLVIPSSDISTVHSV
jgi:hypothetical protein